MAGRKYTATRGAAPSRTTGNDAGRPGERWWRGKSDGMFTFAATQSRQNSLPSMSCITRHDSSSPSAGSVSSGRYQGHRSGDDLRQAENGE